MQRLGRLCLVLGAIGSGAAMAQLNLPNIAQLPRSDFVWDWGRNPGIDERRRPEFEARGVEAQFQCYVTGAFRPASRMRDFTNVRAFEASLNNSIYFIQDTTNTLNGYYRSNDLQWASLDCQIPEGQEDEDKTQERLDRALERAQRARDRRRERESD